MAAAIAFTLAFSASGMNKYFNDQASTISSAIIKTSIQTSLTQSLAKEHFIQSAAQNDQFEIQLTDQLAAQVAQAWIFHINLNDLSVVANTDVSLWQPCFYFSGDKTNWFAAPQLQSPALSNRDSSGSFVTTVKTTTSSHNFYLISNGSWRWQAKPSGWLRTI